MKVDPKMMLPVLAWSPSALAAYEECPRKFQYERMMKLCTYCFAGKMMRPRGSPDGTKTVCTECGRQERPAPPLDFGTMVHGEIENYIRGVGPATANMKLAKKHIEAARVGYKEKKVRLELELAFRKDWSLTEWFGRDAWARFKIDLAHLMLKRLVILKDWKTGKLKEHGEYDDPMECYALGALLAGLGDRTEASLVFTEVQDPKTKLSTVVTTKSGNRSISELPAMKKKWEKKVKKMFVDKRFAPTPGRCKFCKFTANCGGPCEF